MELRLDDIRKKTKKCDFRNGKSSIQDINNIIKIYR